MLPMLQVLLGLWRDSKDIFHLAKESMIFLGEEKVKLWPYLLRFSTFTGIKEKNSTERLFYLLPVMFQVFASIRKAFYSFNKCLLSDCCIQSTLLSARGGAKMNQMGAQFLEVQCSGTSVNFLKYEILNDERHKGGVQIKGYWKRETDL